MNYRNQKFILLLTVAIQLSLILANSSLKFLEETKLLRSALTENCWVDAYGRGVGKAIHTCGSTDYPDQSGLLCYPKCKEGYKGVGPVCWESCPNGFRDDGAFCYKLTNAYGRGVGYIHEDRCVNENKDLGCEKWGLLWYPKCQNGFHNVGCCICSADCPSGMTDIGISCAKQSYGRGVGKPLGCNQSEELQAGLCYSAYCKPTYKAVGPVCWGTCPSQWDDYEMCFGLCLQKDTCAGKIRQLAGDVSKLADDYANKNYIGVVIDISKLISDVVYDNCNKYTALEYLMRNN